MAYYGSQSPAECKLMAGYTGLPFDVACQCTDDIKALRREYMRNGEPMAVTLGKKSLHQNAMITLSSAKNTVA